MDACIYTVHRVLNSSYSQDVESYDPILNPVLNREVRRTGGRVLISLGDQDIDLSPSFNIFLSTRDPSVGAITCVRTYSRMSVFPLGVKIKQGGREGVKMPMNPQAQNTYIHTHPSVSATVP